LRQSHGKPLVILLKSAIKTPKIVVYTFPKNRGFFHSFRFFLLFGFLLFASCFAATFSEGGQAFAGFFCLLPCEASLFWLQPLKKKSWKKALFLFCYQKK
jgi:membrane-bound metal-dependent hydrolase YbcI (DUF457 family)